MKTILIIDDDGPILETFSMALTRKGYHTVTAGSGKEGLEKARRFLPDLILCDINMPGMDGRNVLKTLRQEPELAGKQVVLMTGNAGQITSRSGMDLGADDFLVKPFGLDDLIRCVEARLERAQIHWRVEDQIVANLRSTVNSTLPHEFLTPLAGIMGLTEILLSEFPKLQEEEIREMLESIDESGQRLHRSLRKFFAILDQPSAPGGETPPALDAASVREAIVTATEAALQRHGRTDDLDINLAETTLPVFYQNLCGIVEELADNACVFSRSGSPIKVRLDGNGLLTVTDEGRGMTPQQIEQIGAFRQFDRKKYEQQGLGLGLVLVRNLAGQSGGTLSITSEPGKGSAFSIQFPPSK